MSLTPTTNAQPSSLHHDLEYYLEPFIFQVENVLFRVPKEYFSQESEFFRDMFELARPAGENDLEGSSDSNPYVLPDTISADSFRAFVKLLYHPSPSLADLSKDEWVAILELSRQWNSVNIREIIINKLLPLLNDDPSQQWSLAKSYDIQSWVRPALVRLVRRNESLGVRDYELLDQDTLLKIAFMRECCYPIYHDTTSYGYSYRNNVEYQGIVRWEVKNTRGAISVALDPILFQCPDPLLYPAAEQSDQNNDDDLHKDAEFYFEEVVFKAGNRLYKVPNRPFAQHSPVFRRNFERRGFLKYDHDDPYIIESDVKTTDFANLLRFFFPPELTQKREMASDEWVSIMRLAARWGMKGLKALAVQNLTQTNLGTTENKLHLALDLGIGSWYAECMRAIITRQEHVTVTEVNVLGRDRLLQVLNLRERCHVRQKYNYGGQHIELREERGIVPDNVDLSSQLNAAGL